MRDGRCLCGNLLCRRPEGFFEVKCRRCKRLVLISGAGVPLSNSLRAEAVRSNLPCPLITGNDNVHCLCGSLLARRSNDALEFKCRRCKRAIALPLRPIHQRPEVLRPESETVPAGTG
jgi:phage FluMu protein Com